MQTQRRKAIRDATSTPGRKIGPQKAHNDNMCVDEVGYSTNRRLLMAAFQRGGEGAAIKNRQEPKSSGTLIQCEQQLKVTRLKKHYDF